MTGQPASAKRHDGQDNDQPRSRQAPTGNVWPVCSLPRPGPSADDAGCDDGEQQAERKVHAPSPKIGDGSVRPLLESAPMSQNLMASARLRQRLQDQLVPDEDLQQQRHVADELDVERRHARHEPVVRQPHDADEEAQDAWRARCRGSHQQRVEKAHDQRAAIVGTARIRDERERRRRSPTCALRKLESRRDVAARQVRARC